MRKYLLLALALFLFPLCTLPVALVVGFALIGFDNVYINELALGAVVSLQYLCIAFICNSVLGWRKKILWLTSAVIAVFAFVLAFIYFGNGFIWHNVSFVMDSPWATGFYLNSVIVNVLSIPVYILFMKIYGNKESVIRISEHFDNTDIILVDPCYFIKDDGTWEEYCDDFAENRSLEKMGCAKGLCYSVGDVSPEVLVNPDDFTAYEGKIRTDSHLIGCFRLEDVLAHNPEYAEDMEKYPDSFCIIKGFTGDVVFEIKDEHYYDEMLPMTTVIGIGSPGFHSAFIDYDGEPKLHFSDCTME